MVRKYMAGGSVVLLALALAGCGKEGPFGNTPPQGRPDWMKQDHPPVPPEKRP